MKYYADLHIHSKYSRATSKACDLEGLYLWAQLKGMQVVATGDFLHPVWLDEMKSKLVEAEPGLYKLKDSIAKDIDKQVPAACRGDVRFILSVEISSIYKRLDKVRKVHNVVFAPSLEVATKLQKKLETIGNIRSDGRPILGLDSHDLLEIVLESDPMSFLVPAHIWTPWFALLGSKSGFNLVEDCFGELTKHIFALETGLSSDPIMNWRLKQLDPFILISNSDAHSPQKLARESNIFDTELSYPAMYKALSDPKDKGMKGTVEFFPEEGKYHFDGHRNCKMRMHPKETAKHKGLCPECGKPVVVGVMSRVEELADRKEGEKSARWRPYYSLVPLAEVISQAKGTGPNSKGVQTIFTHMLEKIGNEMFILRDCSLDQIKSVVGELVAEGINRMREGKLHIAAGYDGEYGEVHLFTDEERAEAKGQLSLF